MLTYLLTGGCHRRFAGRPAMRTSSLSLRACLAVLMIPLIAPPLSAGDAAPAPATESFLQRWWDGGSALPALEEHRANGLNKKSRLRTGSVIPETSFRQQLADQGVSFSGAYTAYFLGNISGGLEQDFAYNHMLFFQLDLDFEKLAGWKGGSLVWSFADNAGSDLSHAVGNNFQISTDYGPNTFMFNEFYVRQDLLDGALSIKLGQMSLLNDFLASPLYGLYANLAFCGNPLAVPFNLPATAMPVSSWGAHVKVTQPEWYTQAGVYQVSDRLGLPAYHGADYSIRKGDGTMIFAEAGWTPSFFKREGTSSKVSDGKAVADGKKTFAPVEDAGSPGYPGHYKFGAYFSNWSYAPFDGGPDAANVYGFYVLADQMVFQESDSPSQGLTLWSAFTVSPQEDLAQIPFFVSGGAQYVGLIPYRDGDTTVFGVAYGSYSSDLAAQQAASGAPQEDYEMVFEWSYQIQVNKWLQVQPDVQYIVNPGATHTIPNAWVIGAVVNVSF